tara:strand:+ start:628 stop:1098 length:471 start_codon:yes stop_codon:yes gene_type:complete
MTKKCSKCKKIKDLSLFHKDCTKKDGLRTTCNICKSKVDKIYRKNNKDNLRIKKSEYYYKNIDSIKEYHFNWLEKGGQKIRDIYEAKRYKDNPERSRKYIDAWKKYQIENLTDYYILELLVRYNDIKKEDIPNELVKVKRTHLQLLRAIKDERNKE